MDEIPSGFRRLPGFIEDLYELEAPIGRTISGEVFKAFDRNAHRGVVLWRTITPLAPEHLEKFRARLTLVQRAPHVTPITIFGVDSANVGFAILSSPDRRPINAPVADAVEVERRLLSILAILEHLHENQVVCGDICRESFVLERDGTVCLFGVLGAREVSQSDVESSPPALRRYLPSQVEGKILPSAHHDVLAALLLSEELYASISISGAGAQSRGVAMPAWITGVITALREAASAGESITIRQLRGDLERAKIEENSRAEAPEIIGSPQDQSSIVREIAEKNKARAAKGRQHKVSKLAASRERKILASVGVGMAVVAAIVYGGLLYDEPGTPEKSVVRQAVTDEEVRQVAAWRDSTERAGHENLVRALRAAQSGEYKAVVVKALADRSRRYGLLRAADLLSQQYRLAPAPGAFGNQANSAVLVDALDPSMDRETRNGQFLRLFEQSPQLATVMAVACALDTGELGDVRDLLVRFVGEDASVSEAAERSALALMLFVSGTSQRYSEDFIDRSEKVPSGDLLWLLKQFARTGRADVTMIAQLAQTRKLITGARSVFLDELQHGTTLPPNLRAALAAGALGSLSQDEVSIFGQWYGAGSSRALEAAILTSEDVALKRAAFDSLRGKSIPDTYIATLLEYLQGAHGENAHQFGALLAALGLRDVLDADTIARELSGLDKAPDSRTLLQHVVNGAPYEVLQVVVPRYSSMIEPINLVDLLQHSDKRARVLALEHLSGVNDILLVKLITQAYDEEKDADVRNAYATHISTIRERLGS